MDRFDFRFEPRYVGLWHLPNNPDTQYSGTLFLEKQNIYLELYFQNSGKGLPEEIDFLYGTTYSTDDTAAEEEHLEKIGLQNLSLVRCKHFGGGLKHYKYEVKLFYIYQNELSFNDIKAIKIRMPILDEWASDYLAKGFHDVEKTIPDPKLNIITYYPPSPYFLHTSEDIDICIVTTFCRKISDIRQSITQQANLGITFKKHKNFTESKDTILKFCDLLYLLTNRIFSFEHITFYNNNKFIYKVNEKYYYRYIDTPSSISPQTHLSDFSPKEIKTLFSKWNDLYENYGDAINSFYETQSNLYIPPSSQIRNYISFIDSVTKNFKGEVKEIDLSTKRAKRVKEILEKVDSVLESKDKNDLRMWLLRSNGKEIKVRFQKLIDSLIVVLPQNINSDFVTKVVNTRNNITHPNTDETNCFSKEQYEDVAHKLTQVIRAYMLKEIGVDDNMIIKIIQY